MSDMLRYFCPCLTLCEVTGFGVLLSFYATHALIGCSDVAQMRCGSSNVQALWP